MATQTHSFGTLITWNSQNVGSLSSVGGVEISATFQETTNHGVSDYFKTFVAGLLEVADIAIEGFFDQTDTNGQMAMVTDMNARTSRAVSITFPASTGSVWAATCYVSRIKVGDNPVDGMIPFSASLKVTGKPTLTITTSTGMSALSISNSAVIAPAFAIGTFTYVATVLTGVTSVTVTPTAASHTITVTANGVSQTVTSGNASSAIALGAATSVTPIVISVQETNKAPKVYTIYLTRA